MADAVDEFRRASAALRDGGNRFGAETIAAVRLARQVLDDPETLESERAGSLADFARRILHQHEKTRVAIAAGEPDLAAVWGFRLGKIVAETALKRPSKRGRGRPKGSGAVQADAELLESIMTALTSGLPGAPAARAALKKAGLAAGLENRAKHAVSLARDRLAIGK